MNDYIGCVHFYVFHDFFVIQRSYLYFIYNTNRYFQNKKQDFFKNKTADLSSNVSVDHLQLSLWNVSKLCVCELSCLWTVLEP